MTKLKIETLTDDKPFNMTIKLPATVHRDLTACAAVLKRDAGQAVDANALVAAMWRALWRRIGCLDGRDERFTKTRDNAD